ncbi:MAG: LamG domain-containing protein, partial [Limisphaerales bacterium]
IPDATSLRPASVTLMAWVMFNSGAGTQSIISKPVGAATADSYTLLLNAGNLIGGTTPGGILGVPFNPVVGRWYHLAYSFDDATKVNALYVDGVQVAAQVTSSSISYDNHPILFGADIDNGGPVIWLNGRIDEASIYNLALSSAAIASVYQLGPLGNLPMSSYQRWKLAHLNDPAAPDFGDPDGDGYPTLLEYGLSLSPEIADPAGLPQMSLFDYGSQGRHLRAVLQRDPTHNDITIEVQGSSNLFGLWQNLAASTNGLPFQGVGYVGGDGAGSGIKTVEVRDSVSVTNATQRFLRVKVTH